MLLNTYNKVNNCHSIQEREERVEFSQNQQKQLKKQKQTMNNKISSSEEYNLPQKSLKQKMIKMKNEKNKDNNNKDKDNKNKDKKQLNRLIIRQPTYNKKNNLQINQIDQINLTNKSTQNQMKKNLRIQSLATLTSELQQNVTPKKIKGYLNGGYLNSGMRQKQIHFKNRQKIQSIYYVVDMSMNTPKKINFKDKNQQLQQCMNGVTMTVNKNNLKLLKDKQQSSGKKLKYSYSSYSSGGNNNLKSSKKLLKLQPVNHQHILIQQNNKSKKTNRDISKHSDNFYEVYYNEQKFKKTRYDDDKKMMMKKLNIKQINNQLNRQPYSQKSTRTLKIIRNSQSQTSRNHQINDNIHMEIFTSQKSMKNLQPAKITPNQMNNNNINNQNNNQEELFNSPMTMKNKNNNNKQILHEFQQINEIRQNQLSKMYEKCSKILQSYQERMGLLKNQNEKLKLQNQTLKLKLNLNLNQNTLQ